MLVDMATTAEVSRAARAVFGRPCQASRIALLGSSPVDRVIANFFLGISKVPCPTKFFTAEREALAWLRGSVASFWVSGPGARRSSPGSARTR